MTVLLIVVTVLALVMNGIWSHQRKQQELDDVGIVISEGMEHISENIPESAMQVLPGRIENYFDGLGYTTGEDQDIYQLRVLEDIVKEEGTVIFRCFYEDTNTNTLVIIYDGREFKFEVEEQME